MPSIDDFVAHRWADAKGSLRQLDSEFVRRHETTVRLQNMNWLSPFTINPNEPPERRLSRKWHSLLESCNELVWREMTLRESVSSLVAEGLDSLSVESAGARSFFALRSWFIFMVAICEQVETVVRRTLDVHLKDPKIRKELAAKFRSLVHERVRAHVSEQRNQLIHGDRGSLAQGITEDNLWEGEVSIGLTPRLALEQFHMPAQGKRAQAGQYDPFKELTQYRCEQLGQILFELEGELSQYGDLKYPLSGGA